MKCDSASRLRLRTPNRPDNALATLDRRAILSQSLISLLRVGFPSYSPTDTKIEQLALGVPTARKQQWHLRLNTIFLPRNP
jgi:hypothetical protein